MGEQEQSNHLAREYAKYLDETLPGLEGNEARWDFLYRRLQFFERQYGSFLERLDDDDFDPGNLSAFDFAMTISEISVRLAKYEGARHA